MKKNEEAAMMLDKVIQLNPVNEQAYYIKG